MKKWILYLLAVVFLISTSSSTYNKYGSSGKASKKVSCRSVKTKQFGKVY